MASGACGLEEFQVGVSIEDWPSERVVRTCGKKGRVAFTGRERGAGSI